MTCGTQARGPCNSAPVEEKIDVRWVYRSYDLYAHSIYSLEMNYYDNRRLLHLSVRLIHSYANAIGCDKSEHTLLSSITCIYFVDFQGFGMVANSLDE